MKPFIPPAGYYTNWLKSLTLPPGRLVSYGEFKEKQFQSLSQAADLTESMGEKINFEYLSVFAYVGSYWNYWN